MRLGEAGFYTLAAGLDRNAVLSWKVPESNFPTGRVRVPPLSDGKPLMWPSALLFNAANGSRPGGRNPARGRVVGPRLR